MGLLRDLAKLLIKISAFVTRGIFCVPVLPVKLFLISFILAGCQTYPPEHGRLDLIPKTWEDLPGWQEDSALEALPALQRSCLVLLNRNSETPFPGQGERLTANWKPFCTQVINNAPQSDAELRALIQGYLTPYLASCDGTTQGLFTGYDEPELRGSLRRHGPYQTPLYRLPGKNTTYKGMTRSRIVAGGLKGRHLEVVWVDDPVDAFFIQIQGSGRVRLEDGHVMRLGYAGTNGCPYFAIGKALIDRGILTTQNVSRQTIRAWLKAHPRTAESVMSLNKSYVFFRIRHGKGPIGCQGVALTPERSLAIDRRYIPLGAPLWIDLSHPLENNPDRGRIQSLVVAQDTGGAIKGAIRGDLFWGCGARAAELAGRMKSSGEYYLLLPK